MNKIILNSLVSWKLLPWMKISQRVFILQQKVYKFSKRCNQCKVHKFQDYIINSNDIKIFAIQKIINNINKYYDDYNKEKYKIKDIDKLYIYVYLFNIQKYKKSAKIISEYIKQYLVYMCLKPEWESRLEPIYRLGLNILGKLSYIQQAYNFLFVYNQSTKYLAISYFTKRIQSLPYIQHYISYWLSYQSIRYSFSMKCIYYNSYRSIFSCLGIIINYIVFNGLQWYLLCTFNISKKNNKIFQKM